MKAVRFPRLALLAVVACALACGFLTSAVPASAQFEDPCLVTPTLPGCPGADPCVTFPIFCTAPTCSTPPPAEVRKNASKAILASCDAFPPVTYTITDDPDRGDPTGTHTPKPTYTPDEDYEGSDSYSYKAANS